MLIIAYHLTKQHANSSYLKNASTKEKINFFKENNYLFKKYDKLESAMFANYDKETYKRIGKTEYEEFFVTKIGEEYIYIEVPHRQGGR